jgi:hypothetical protein
MLKLNPNSDVQASRVTERDLCVVIDDFLLNPEEIVAFACEHREAFIAPERAYPGRVLPVDNRLLDELHHYIQRSLSRMYPFHRGGIDFHTQLCLTTLQPADFTWIQRLCHSDPRLDPERVNYAALIYLFEDTEMGGTGFYRWREPEFWESMTELQRDDPDGGLDLLEKRFALFRNPPCYMTGSNEAAELLDEVPARFNRFVFYPGELPHNAQIRRPELLSDDPARGRLTLNCFVSALPRRD